MPDGELDQAVKCSTASYRAQTVRPRSGGKGLAWNQGADYLATVDRDEVDRLRKRFMKLDKVRAYLHTIPYTIPRAHCMCRTIREQ